MQATTGLWVEVKNDMSVKMKHTRTQSQFCYEKSLLPLYLKVESKPTRVLKTRGHIMSGTNSGVNDTQYNSSGKPDRVRHHQLLRKAVGLSKEHRDNNEITQILANGLCLNINWLHYPANHGSADKGSRGPLCVTSY